MRLLLSGLSTASAMSSMSLSVSQPRLISVAPLRDQNKISPLHVAAIGKCAQERIEFTLRRRRGGGGWPGRTAGYDPSGLWPVFGRSLLTGQPSIASARAPKSSVIVLMNPSKKDASSV
jgi:hypothetical protein